MAQDTLPAITQDAGTSAAEAPNAQLLNRQLSAVIEALGDGSEASVALLNDIAAAIASSIIGGTTGATANRLLRSKGTSGFALQNSPVTVDDSGNMSGVGALTAGSIDLTTPLAIADGGTGQSTQTAAFDALAPTTTQGDVIYHNGTDNVRLAAGTSGYLLQTLGSGANPQWVGAMPLLASGTMSSQATLDIPLTSFTAYAGIIIKLVILPATDGVDLYCRFSTDGGSTFAATNYGYGALAISDDGGVVGGVVSSVSGTTFILMNVSSANRQIGNASTEGWMGSIEILNPTSTAFWSRMTYQGAYASNAATSLSYSMAGQGTQKTAQDTNAIRFLFSSGNIASGFYRVYGIT